MTKSRLGGGRNRNMRGRNMKCMFRIWFRCYRLEPGNHRIIVDRKGDMIRVNSSGWSGCYKRSRVKRRS